MQDMTKSKKKPEEKDHAKENAHCGYLSIVEMVAALNCDYDRLEKLRDECDAWESKEEADGKVKPWAIANENDAAELAALEEVAGECESQDDACQRIDEDPLDIRVRTGWNALGEQGVNEEFEILLTTGGPALRIRGELDGNQEPKLAWLEYQDWGTPWTQYVGADQDTLLAYCRHFCWEVG